jgi:hypothetical protein
VSRTGIGDAEGCASTIKYYTFGLTREQSGTLPTDKLFTGHQKEPDDGVAFTVDASAQMYGTYPGRVGSVARCVGVLTAIVQTASCANAVASP